MLLSTSCDIRIRSDARDIFVLGDNHGPADAQNAAVERKRDDVTYSVINREMIIAKLFVRGRKLLSI